MYKVNPVQGEKYYVKIDGEILRVRVNWLQEEGWVAVYAYALGRRILVHEKELNVTKNQAKNTKYSHTLPC